MTKTFAATFALLLGLASAASAATYDVVFDGDTADFTATIETDADDQMTAISGWFNGSDAITGFQPGSNNGLWWWDNEFGASEPYVDWYGILFTTEAGVTANLFFDQGHYVLSYSPGNYIPGAIGTLSVTEVAATASAAAPAPVPLPAAGLLLLGGIGALGAARRRKAA